MDYNIAIKELCRYRLFACLLKLAWGQICSMACGTWQFGLAFRFFNCGIDENLYVEILYMITLVCIIKWKIHVVLRITNGKKKLEFTVQCCLLHDLFACDGNQFGLFGSKVSLEVPVAAQFGLRAVAYISSHQVIEDFAGEKKDMCVQVSREETKEPGRPEWRRTTQEDISIKITSVQKQSVRHRESRLHRDLMT
ncbi:hypothetical protein T09_13873 [Trichinella sp. T9]|nr:hypothetical protein T09_13873 [Trichinella sp. T9]